MDWIKWVNSISRVQLEWPIEIFANSLISMALSSLILLLDALARRLVKEVKWALVIFWVEEYFSNKAYI